MLDLRYDTTDVDSMVNYIYDLEQERTRLKLQIVHLKAKLDLRSDYLLQIILDNLCQQAYESAIKGYTANALRMLKGYDKLLARGYKPLTFHQRLAKGILEQDKPARPINHALIAQQRAKEVI
jgi:hypothetical protein